MQKALFSELQNIISQARTGAVRSINSCQVAANYLIGQRLVEHEQEGQKRAKYGKETLVSFSSQLTDEFGKGFSATNLELMRKFYKIYSQSNELEAFEIPQTVSEEFVSSKKQLGVTTKLASVLSLSWPHYVCLMSLSHGRARRFYTIESASKNWSLRELKRQIDSALFERLALSTDKEGVKTLAEKQFQTQADQQFLNAATDFLIESTKFDLPKEFLIKWLEVGNDKPLTHEEAVAEYERSEKGLRYQLLEGKIATDNNLQVTYEDLKKHTEQVITGQYIQYGMPAPTEEQLKDIVDQTLSNQDEARQLSEQVMSKKLLDFYKENLKYKSKEVTYKEFVEETYK